MSLYVSKAAVKQYDFNNESTNDGYYDAEISTLQSQIKELKTLVSELQGRNKNLEKEIQVQMTSDFVTKDDFVTYQKEVDGFCKSVDSNFTKLEQTKQQRSATSFRK